MRTYRLLLAFLLLAGLLPGQLTSDQKVADFQHLASLYAKNYGPYEWKRDVLNFDLLDTGRWVAKVSATKTDLEFFDVMSEYVAGLNDAHDVYILPSNFVARLNFSVDVYEGRLLVDFINRSRLPAAEFPFLPGYELVSIDSVDANLIVDRYLRYSVAANEKSTRRLTAELLTTRPQQLIPSAPEVPEISTVVFRRPDGTLESHRIPWTRSGLPLTTVGRYPAASVATTEEEREEEPDYLKVLQRLQNCRLPDRSVLNFGARAPVFVNGMGSWFTRRLGGAADDVFYSGVFEVGYRMGYIRIPNFGPASAAAALAQFAQEIAYFQANTDGLIVDVMRNPGGSVGYTNQLLALVIPYKWNSLGFEVRATSNWVLQISSALESAKAQGAPEHIITLLGELKRQIVTANSEFRGRTGPIPLDDVTIERNPAMDARGAVIAYRKPLMLLVDEMSASGGDYFAATIQDNQRGPLFGWRTMGAGGNVTNWQAGSYSQGTTSLTESLMHRGQDVVTPDFPVTRYVENVGVRPDIEYDYMRRENLQLSGAPFVEAFLHAMYSHIQRGN
ncbi:MAG TPA: S41 family peptidase [Bryobacteraceae bacterium]|nr:S41 family peptidase [Bryobacteraceae bacterium]